MQFFRPHRRRDSDIGLDSVGNRPLPPVIRGSEVRDPALANEVLSEANICDDSVGRLGPEAHTVPLSLTHDDPAHPYLI